MSRDGTEHHAAEGDGDPIGSAAHGADAPASRPTLVHRVEVAASVENVWAAITDPRFTEQYFYGLAVTSDWKVGSRIVFERAGEVKVEGTILEIEPPRRLRHSVRLLRDADTAADLPSRVTWEVEARGSGCVVTVIHDEFVEETASYRIVAQGWGLVLEGLRELIETGAATRAQAQWPDYVKRPR